MCSTPLALTNINYRAPEELVMHVKIPSPFEAVREEAATAAETFLLQKISPAIRELRESYRNVNKEAFARARFDCQEGDARIVRRSGIQYSMNENAFLLHVNIDLPLLNGVAVNQKPSESAVKDILSTIYNVLESCAQADFDVCIKTHRIQKQIRAYLAEHGFCAFIANGSVLPREKDTDKPMQNAIPFCSPKSLEIAIPIGDERSITGLGIKRGVTVITGGGYSGKSTLIDALQEGIYDRLPGDGREFVITDASALQTYAEDGRPISNLDLSPFFHHLPGGAVANFSTDHASGSVSQAANIVEAVCGGCKLVLVDEDKSATNLMICDEVMRQLIKQETIIPFTDRIRELYQTQGVSTVVVIGGCSEYLFCADCVMMMEHYTAVDVTDAIAKYASSYRPRVIPPVAIQTGRKLVPLETNQEFYLFKNVHIAAGERRTIGLDQYTADITVLAAIKNASQMNTLAGMLVWLLGDKQANRAELIQLIAELLGKLFSGEESFTVFNVSERRYYEEVRPIDAYYCVNRVRGVRFEKNEE